MAYTKQQIKEDKKNWWYWTERQNAITNKNIKATEAQLKKYYKSAMNNIIGQFEATYNKVLLSIEDGREPTPADLYKLDTYWKQQGELQKALTRLGDKQAAILSKNFMNEWRHIYEGVAAKDDLYFSGVSFENAEQMINQIWCADGKSWSSRVWKNTELLQQELNDSLIDCLLTGRNPSELKQRLIERFNVAYNRADSIVRTEITHIQTQAARQRYSDAGVKEVEVWADEDERRCDKCGKLHQKRFPVGGAMPIPAHPRCRCCIIPVVEVEEPVEEPQELKQEPQKRERKRNIDDYRNRKKAIFFDGMSKEEIIKWSKENLKTSIDYKGCSEEVARLTTKAVYEIENKGIDLHGVSIAFGKTGSSYGLFNRNTKTLYLRSNTNFVDKMKELDAISYRKSGKPYYAVSSYTGVVNHELGHLIDDFTGHKVSQMIANDERVYREALISHYATVRPHDIRANKATETFAECFSAYMEGGAAAAKLPKEVINWIKKIIGKF